MKRRDFLTAVAAASALRGAAGVRVACQTRAYGSPIRDRAKLLAVLEDLAAAGYEGFETNYQSLAHSFGDPGPMRLEIERRKITLLGLHYSTALHDPARLDQEHQGILEVARATRAFGGEYVVLSSGPVPGEALTRRCQELNRAGRVLRDLGVRLLFHNHTHELEDDARHLRAVMGRTDPALVSLMLDVGNRFPPGYPAAAAARDHLQRIAGFHLRDTIHGSEVSMGTGEFDFAALARLIREGGWSGWLVVEVNQRPDTPSRKLVEDCRAYVRKTMKF
jgi:inosose dehydratase